MMVVLKFAPGDKVKWGPHEGYITQVTVAQQGMIYSLAYFDEAGDQNMAQAYDFELTLIERLQKEQEAE